MRIAALAAVTFFSVAAHAQSGAEQTLRWKGRGEILAYRTCGCADACWVAEVRDRRTKAVKAKLRCDCEKLYLTRAGAAEELYMETCSLTNGLDLDAKPGAIRRILETELRR